MTTKRKCAYRKQMRISEHNKDGGTMFHECKRYDKNGKLIETVSPDTMMSTVTNRYKKRTGKKPNIQIKCTNKDLRQLNRDIKHGHAEGKSLSTGTPIKSRKF
jgi:hypothetical protein